MASVAVCPHCKLQLFIPDHVETDAHVQCPTCRETFDLQDATLRVVPEVVPVDPMTAAAEALEKSLGARLDVSDHNALDETHADLDTADQADENFAKWFAASKTVEDVTVPPRTPTLAELWPERAKEIQAVAGVSEAYKAASTLPPSKMPEPELPHDLPLGPSFDLPNVPLAPENKHTVEIGPDSVAELAGVTDFALDDVDLDDVDVHNQATIAEIKEPIAVPDFTEKRERSEVGGTPLDAFPTFIVQPPARRRRSVVRTLVGATLGGFAGLAVGYYLFLYFLGPQGDFLQVADRMPKWLLPKSFAASSPAPSRIMEAVETGSKNPAPPVGNESANVQASYEAESNTESPTVLPEDKHGIDEKHAELAPAEDPLVTPLPNELPRTMETPHIEGAPSYTTEQWSAALTAAREAQAGLENGDLSDPAVRRTKGLSYAKFCDLAQMSTLCDPASGDVEQLDRDTQALFQNTLAKAHTRDEVARIADIWIESPNRRHGGVFTTGKLNGGSIIGKMYEFQLSTENASSMVLLMAHPPEGAESTGQAVAVVGTIVDDPAKRVPGYDGDAPRVIWVSRLIPLD
jgi:hypothetical protein